jgi:hypothetical protein
VCHCAAFSKYIKRSKFDIFNIFSIFNISNIFNIFIAYYPRYCMIFLICVDSSSQKRWMFHVTFELGLDESRDWDVTGSSRKDSSDLSWSHGARTAGRRFRSSQRWLGEVKTQGTLVMMVMVQD